MNLVKWWISRFTNRGKTLLLCRKGMSKARNGDPEGAIADYTAVIETPDAAPKVKAMALYNRALVNAAAGKDSNATKDLKQVLEMKGAPTDIKTEARRKVVRMQRRSDKRTFEEDPL